MGRSAERPRHDYSLKTIALAERKETGHGFNNQSYLCNEASIKILKVWNSESFCVDEHICVPGGWCTSTSQGQKLLHSRPFQTLPYVPLHLAVSLYFSPYSLLYNKLVDVSVFLSSMSCSSKLIEPREDVKISNL